MLGAGLDAAEHDGAFRKTADLHRRPALGYPPVVSLAAFLRRPRALADGDTVQVEGSPVRLCVSARATRVSLRVDTTRREVVATAPSARRLKDALAFAQARAGWIAARLEALPEPRPFAPGQTIPFEGRPCRLERAAMRTTGRVVAATALETQRLVAAGEGEAFARAVVRTLKREALSRLVDRTARHVARLDRPLPPVSVADARGRWGSCRGPDPRRPEDRGAIRYSWRLVCAPPQVLDYVAAHEAAHLARPDHSPDFWALNRELYGAPLEPVRRWLKAHGAELHALGR